MGKQDQTLRILICDDDPQDRKLIRSYLQAIESQKIITLEAGQMAETPRAIGVDELDIILTDINLPDKSGMAWLKELIDTQLAPVIILTGCGDEETTVKSLPSEAVGYLPKRKLSAESLAETIDETVREWRGLMLIRGNLTRLERLASLHSITGELIRQKFLKASRKIIGGETMATLAKIVDFRDPFTAAHQQRVTQLACAIAGYMNLTEERLSAVKLAGLIHDIGKVSVPTKILCNPNQLSEAEFKIIKMHPETGYEILKSLDLPWPIAEIIRQHHERIDGSGYPRGLSGEDILLEARILSVADVVEAMSSHRPHRPSLGLNHALHEILKNKGRLYDADVVDACLKVFRELGFEFTYRNGEPSSAQTLTAASVHK